MFFIIIPFLLSGQSKNTNIFTSFGADLNGNIYSAKFQKLPGIDNCCVEFGNTFGLRYGFHAGLEFLFPKKFEDMDVRADISVSYSNLSANFSKNAFIGNIITGNNFTQGIVEHKIEARLSAIILDPGVYIYPLKDIHLSVRGGFQLGYLLSKSFRQSENLLEPQNITFENHQRTRNVVDSTLPNAGSFLFALSLGIRYEAYNNGNFCILPEIRFNYGLSKIISGLDWKASSLQAGVMLTYNFPKADVLPPLFPPLPPMPEPTEPPQQSRVDLTINYYDKNYTIITGNEIEVPIKSEISKNVFYQMPLIFYKKNSIEENIYLSSDNDRNNLGEGSKNNDVLNSLLNYLKSRSKVKVKVISSSVDDESDEIINKRINIPVDFLTSNGIDAARIQVEKIYREKSEFKIDELADENRFLKFKLSDSTELLATEIETKNINSLVNNNDKIIIKTEAKGDAPPIILNNLITKNGSVLAKFTGNNDYNLNIDESVIDIKSISQVEIELTSKGVDAYENSSVLNKKLILKPVIKEIKIIQNEFSPYNSNDTSQQYILCYFNYNESEILVSNPDVIDIVKKELESGKKVELIPLTDNIGTELYNRKLAGKRLQSALNLLKIKSNMINPVFPDYYLFSNNSPFGRYLNRTVIVRIKN